MKLITLTKIKRTLIDVEENAINASLASNGDRDGKLRKVQDGINEICDIINNEINKKKGKVNDNFQFDCFCSARQLGFSITPTNKIIINDGEKFKELFFILAHEYLKLTNENKIIIVKD